MVTSGDPVLARTATLAIDACAVTQLAGQDGAYTYPAHGMPYSRAALAVHANNNLRCSAAIDSIKLPLPPPPQFVFMGRALNVQFPLSWSADAALSLSIIRDSSDAIVQEAISGCLSSAMAVWWLNDSTGAWEQKATTFSRGGLYRWSLPVSKPGVYALFGDAANALDIRVYPNPIRQGGRICFQGKGILEILIYSLNGTLVLSERNGLGPLPQTDLYHFSGTLVNQTNKNLAPGTYFAVVGYTDPITRGARYFKQKIMVLP